MEGEGAAVVFLLSDEPLCSGDVITQHHKKVNPVFLEHFILQTKEDFCTYTLFSSLVGQSW